MSVFSASWNFLLSELYGYQVAVLRPKFSDTIGAFCSNRRHYVRGRRGSLVSARSLTSRFVPRFNFSERCVVIVGTVALVHFSFV